MFDVVLFDEASQMPTHQVPTSTKLPLTFLDLMPISPSSERLVGVSTQMYSFNRSHPVPARPSAPSPALRSPLWSGMIVSSLLEKGCKV